MQVLYKHIYLVIILTLLVSCVKNKEFTQDKVEYKSALRINSQYDEIDPIIYEDNLYVLAVYNINSKTYSEVLKSQIRDNDTYDIIVFDQIYNGMIPTSTPSIFYNKLTKIREYYFSARECEECDSDLFYTFEIDDIFATPIPLDVELNSDFDELQPRISENGKKLIFVSSNNSIGGKDLFYTVKNSNGYWESPKNFGFKINTVLDEESPIFGKNNNFYFSSNGISKKNNFDIYKVGYDFNRNNIESITKLPDVINTNYNEKSYNQYEDFVYYSSDRFGNYDIIQDYRCMNALLSLEFEAEYNDLENTRVIIKNEDGVEIINEIVSNKYLEYELLQNNMYEIEIKNDCFKDFNFKKVLNIPCNDIKNLVYNYKINIPTNRLEYSFEEVNIPFFVTGYYYPNTSRNLNELKLLFKQNRFSSDSTNYVEEPSEKYEKYALEIDKAFNSIKELVQNKFSSYENGCFSNNEFIKINIIGFSDPRVIAKGMKYFGPSISDNSVDLNIANGDNFNNLQLSKLRAYHTANEIKHILSNLPNYEKYKNQIIWNISGQTEKNNNIKNFDLSRRVMIKIENIPYENN